MNKDHAIKIEHVSKTFKLPTEATNSLRTSLVNRMRGIKGYKEQKVLKDISFEVEKGDFFGIVGRNGSGKSTLLKIMSQIYTPEKGTVSINGKLVSFIELGVGFNPELTGKENVYLNGAMLGFSREEVANMYDEIVEFAELDEFMNQKLKNYSSGMQVRLAFSVAIKAKGDILVLDEVLAVGDEAFQRKCNSYFMERKNSGQTTILVTHDMGAVQKYCNKALLIKDGLIEIVGDPAEVSNRYSIENLNIHKNEIENKESKQGSENDDTSKKVTDVTIELLSNDILTENDEIKFKISYNSLENIKSFIAFSITDVDRNLWLYNDNSMDYMQDGMGKHSAVYTCYLKGINKSKVKLSAVVRNEKGENLAYSIEANSPSFIVGSRTLTSESERDSATGLLCRKGVWRFN